MGEACFILHLNFERLHRRLQTQSSPIFFCTRWSKQTDEAVVSMRCRCCWGEASAGYSPVRWQSAAVWHCLDLAARFKQKTTNLPDQKPLKPAPVNQLSPDWLGEWLHTGQYPVSPLTLHSAHLKKINTNVYVFKTKLMILSFNPKGTGFTGFLQTPLHSCTCALMESKEWTSRSPQPIWKAENLLHTQLTHNCSRVFCVSRFISVSSPRLFLFRLTLH